MKPSFPTIHMGEPKAIHLSPSWETHEAQNGKGITWGYHQFPDICCAPGGEFYVHVNIGPDTGFGDHEEPAWYVSRDGGVEWEATTREKVDLRPLPITLPDGRQVRIGEQQHLPHYAHADKENYRVYAERYGLKPVFGPFFHAYTASEDVAYRLCDLPEEARSIPLAWRESESAEWQSSRAVFDVEGMLITCGVRFLAWWSGKKADWREREPCIDLPRFSHVVVLPDGTMIAPAMSQHPDVTDRKYMQVLCLQSTDAGRTWTRRGVIAGDTELTTHGYFFENQVRLAPNGDLVGVIRTLGDLDPTASRWLAQCRSTDGGRTWSWPRKIAEFSVTPQLIVLDNGAMVVGYGRPGIYLRTSADSAKTWSDPITVHGAAETDLPEEKDAWFDEHRKRYTCANISTVVTGPDRFLLVYSDFQHPHPDGGNCKAILVREVVVEY